MENLGLGKLILVAVVILSIDAAAQEKGFDPFPKRRGPTPPVSSNVISSVEFVDTPITTVFKMISDLTGWSVMMSPEVSQKPPRINIWIKDMSPEDVLNQVIELAGLVADRKRTTVTVMTFEEYCRLFGVEKRVLQLEHVAAKEVVEILKPFLGKLAQYQIIAHQGGNKVVLLVPRPLLDSLERLVRAVDVPFEYETDTVKIVPLKHLEASVIVQALEQFLTQTTGTSRSAGAVGQKRGSAAQAVGGAKVEPAGAGDNYLVRFMAEPKLNVIVLRGSAEDVAKAMDLICKLDQPRGIRVVSYELKYTNAPEVFETLEKIVRDEEAPGRQERLRLALSEQNNRIVVEGSSKDHERVAKVIEAIDRALPAGMGGIRVYRLENTTAAEVAQIINELIDSTAKGPAKAVRQRSSEPLQASVGGIRRVKKREDAEKKPKSSAKVKTSEEGEPGKPAPGEELPSVIAAPEINAVIIKATAAEHEGFAELIRELDKPRDQVVLEVTGVMVRSSEGFDLGLELGGARINDSGAEMVGFTHFGIGSVDTATGAIRLAAEPLFGLNYAIFNSSDFSLVLNALKTVGDTRIVSAPKLLVEDNSEARISQINQEPFEVTDQGETTTTTTFGGFVDAGTVLTVTPHLSEEDWLRLVYTITFSSFGNRVSESLPPPRLQNQLSGTARIPAGHMIVLGGLVSSREGKVLHKIPFISDIPWIGELFKNRSRDDLKETLFVFIRPVFVRDRDFENLIYLSKGDVENAGVAEKDRPTNPLKMFPWPFDNDSTEQ